MHYHENWKKCCPTQGKITQFAFSRHDFIFYNLFNFLLYDFLISIMIVVGGETTLLIIVV